MTGKESIMVALFFGRLAKRLPGGSWRWVVKQPGNPKLSNYHVSGLFKEALVEVRDGHLKLTEIGLIKASKIKID